MPIFLKSRPSFSFLSTNVLTQVPPSLLTAFNESELLRLLVGQPTVDVNEIRAFAQFQVSPYFPTFTPCTPKLPRGSIHPTFVLSFSFFLGQWRKVRFSYIFVNF